MYDPLKDGQDHINIYSKGVTVLGRYLSNFTYSPINTVDGAFTSIEGYWYWLGSHGEVLRMLHGFGAKQVGKKLPRQYVLTDEEFQTKIRNACWIKIHTMQHMLTQFTQSTLPFAHYYSYGNKPVDAGFKWLVDMWTQYRMHIKNGYKI